MSEINCNVGMLNTGQACVPVMKVQKKFIAVQTYDSTGTLNEIDLTGGPFNAAYFSARVNDVDPSTRWYPLPEVKNVTNERGESLMETFGDQTKVFIEQGVRTVTAMIIASDAPPQMVRKIRGMRGIGISIFAVDKENNLIGKVGSSATKFSPIELESDTIDAILVLSQDEAIQKIKLSFDININEDDAQMAMIQSTELDYNVSLLRGLIDVTSEISAISTTSFTSELRTDGGTPLNPVLVKNLVSADFVSSDSGTPSRLYNVDDALDVTIISVVESPAGVYTFTFAAQGSGETLVLKPLKAGFDFTEVEANTILIP